MTGTVINFIAIILGGTLGTFLGARLPERVRETVMHGLGLLVFVIGLQMTLTTHNVLIPMASILIGGIVGELLGIQTGLDSVGKALEQRFARDGETGKFARGFVTGSLVFCIGPLAILGAIQDGQIGRAHV